MPKKTIINPKTGRKIIINGPTHKKIKLEKQKQKQKKYYYSSSSDSSSFSSEEDNCCSNFLLFEQKCDYYDPHFYYPTPVQPSQKQEEKPIDFHKEQIIDLQQKIIESNNEQIIDELKQTIKLQQKIIESNTNNEQIIDELKQKIIESNTNNEQIIDKLKQKIIESNTNNEQIIDELKQTINLEQKQLLIKQNDFTNELNELHLKEKQVLQETIKTQQEIINSNTNNEKIKLLQNQNTTNLNKINELNQINNLQQKQYEKEKRILNIRNNFQQLDLTNLKKEYKEKYKNYQEKYLQVKTNIIQGYKTFINEQKDKIENLQSINEKNIEEIENLQNEKNKFDENLQNEKNKFDEINKNLQNEKNKFDEINKNLQNEKNKFDEINKNLQNEKNKNDLQKNNIKNLTIENDKIKYFKKEISKILDLYHSKLPDIIKIKNIKQLKLLLSFTINNLKNIKEEEIKFKEKEDEKEEEDDDILYLLDQDKGKELMEEKEIKVKLSDYEILIKQNNSPSLKQNLKDMFVELLMLNYLITKHKIDISYSENFKKFFKINNLPNKNMEIKIIFHNKKAIEINYPKNLQENFKKNTSFIIKLSLQIKSNIDIDLENLKTEQYGQTHINFLYFDMITETFYRFDTNGTISFFINNQLDKLLNMYFKSFKMDYKSYIDCPDNIKNEFPANCKFWSYYFLLYILKNSSKSIHELYDIFMKDSNIFKTISNNFFEHNKNIKEKYIVNFAEKYLESYGKKIEETRGIFNKFYEIFFI